MQTDEPMSGGRRRMLHVLDEVDSFSHQQGDPDWWEGDVHGGEMETMGTDLWAIRGPVEMPQVPGHATPQSLALFVHHLAKANAAITEAIQKTLKPETFHAVIDDELVAFANIEEKFAALAKIWRKHVRGKSVISYSHPAYFQVMGMGRSVVPLLLREVSKGVGTWYVALQSIVGEPAESIEMRGDAAAVREAWLDWGRRNGYWSE